MPHHFLPNRLLPLSDDELDELDRFLKSDATSYETMMIDMLDGYLTAIAIGPTTLDLKQWFSGIWGTTKEDAPNFKSMEEARHIIDLIIRQMNDIVSDFEDDPDNVTFIFNTVVYPDSPQEYTDADMWAHGFMCGIDLCRKDWQALFDDPDGVKMLRPLYLLGSDDVTAEEEALTETPDQCDKLARQIVESVAWIYRFWLPYRQAIIERNATTTMQ